MQFRNTEDGRVVTVSGDAAIAQFSSSTVWVAVTADETPPVRRSPKKK